VYNQPILIEKPPKRPTIERVTVAAAPLYSVVTLADALSIIDLVGRPQAVA
jgi:hypothetical protein